MKLTVGNRVTFAAEGLGKETLKKIRESFKYNNPEFFRKRQLGIWTGNVQRVIATYRVEDEGRSLSVPRGALPRLIKILREQGEEPEVLDVRFSGPPVAFDFDPSFQWRPYQTEGINAILENETCLVQGAPGSGKTEIVLGSIARAGLRTGVVVHDTNLLDQWVKRIEARLGIPARDVGIIGQGKWRLGEKITVMMQQSIRNKLDRLKDTFGFIALDECHHASARTFLETMDFFDSRFRVGASATIKRQDLKHFLTHDMFGQVVFQVSRNELEDLGFLTSVTLHIVPTEFDFDYMNERAVKGALEGTFKDWEDLSGQQKRSVAESLGLEPRDYGQYLDAISRDRDRNKLIYDWVRQEYDRGSKMVIFTKRRTQCELWRDRLAQIGIEVVILWGAKAGKDRARITQDLKRLKAGKVRIAIGTVLDEGIDMPSVDCGFITYRNATNAGQIEQQAGRLARLFVGKEESRLYYFHDERIDRFNEDVGKLKRRFRKVVVHGGQSRFKKIRFKG